MVEQTTTQQHETYERMHASREFIELRRRYIGFAFPMTVAFMVWYLLYVLASSWANDFMATQVVGNINVALVFGLLQFVSTFLIAWLYGRHANRKLDPLAAGLNAKFKRERRR
jgi:uncharacterized membrane protein (DUF485 family)